MSYIYSAREYGKDELLSILELPTEFQFYGKDYLKDVSHGALGVFLAFEELKPNKGEGFLEIISNYVKKWPKQKIVKKKENSKQRLHKGKLDEFLVDSPKKDILEERYSTLSMIGYFIGMNPLTGELDFVEDNAFETKEDITNYISPKASYAKNNFFMFSSWGSGISKEDSHYVTIDYNLDLAFEKARGIIAESGIDSNIKLEYCREYVRSAYSKIKKHEEILKKNNF